MQCTWKCLKPNQIYAPLILKEPQCQTVKKTKATKTAILCSRVQDSALEGQFDSCLKAKSTLGYCWYLCKGISKVTTCSDIQLHLSVYHN